ncbi:MAG: phage tail sheath subtilisin-like domain-containing protein [Nitrospira sp.]|nr:phage tail sheath subtilisin-like domain-containing protein [Nitrospira sp.]
MAVQVSYPGVYNEEFTPGAPIEGVGTSTAAFIGTALQGPIEKPTLIQSWDDFKRVFGGFIDERPRSYLAPAVNGFFVNGGTACYVLRVGGGKMSFKNLDSRQGGRNPDPVLVATARLEGTSGDAISVQVVDQSRSESNLPQTIPTQTITNIANPPRTLTVANHGYSGGEIVRLVEDPAQGNNEVAVVVQQSVGNNQLDLVDAIPPGINYTNGSLVLALGPKRVRVQITNVSQNRQQLTVTDNSQFVPGDRLVLIQGGNQVSVVVGSTGINKTVDLVAPIPAGSPNFGQGNNNFAQTADLVQGQRIITLGMPSSLQLNQILPRGTIIKIEQKSGGRTISEIAVVASSGGNSITLETGLKKSYSLASAVNVPTITSLEFKLIVNDPTLKEPEKFEFLSMHPNHPSYWLSAVQSEFVVLAEPTATPNNPLPDDLRPATNTYQLAQGQDDNRSAALGMVRGNPVKFLDYLKPIDEISLVAIPGETDKVVQQAIIVHCETMQDRFAILDSKPDSQPGNGIRAQFADVRSGKGFAALYYPWIIARNLLTGKDEPLPPSGHLAGIYARTDSEPGRGVHVAPANTNIRGALGLEKSLTDAQQGPLNMMGVNVLRIFQGQSQPVVWGARTTAGDLNRNWQYITVRRLFMFIEESIQENIRWAVFQPNNLQLWQKLKRTITEFLTRVWRDGALFGKTQEDAFYVRIDEALNPVSTQKLGRLYIEIGLRPTYPAEFIIVRIGVWDGGSEIVEA